MAVEELSGLPKLGPLYRAAALDLFRRRTATELPDVAFLVRDVPVTLDHLAAYNRVCGFRLTDAVPATYPHVLAFPVVLMLLSRRDFPLPLPGLVHTVNRIEALAPIGLDDRLSFRVSAGGLRDHARGKQVDVVTTATRGEDPVWREVSTYLWRDRKSRGGPAPRTEASGTEPPATELPPPEAIWSVPADLGRRYAKASGDHNPIHTRRLAAQLSGLPGRIAHGMWTAARALAALEGRVPGVLVLESRFTAPLPLGSRVGFHAEHRTLPTPAAGRADDNWPKPAWLAAGGDDQPPADPLWQLTVAPLRPGRRPYLSGTVLIPRG